MKYFTISELTKSNTAIIHHIDNSPSKTVVDNLEVLVNNCLDPIRERWGKPIRVTSGYRCPALNKKVNGSKTSHHLSGCAADITTGNKRDNKKLFELIEEMHRNEDIEFTQLIDENNYLWIHISYRKDNLKNQILHLA